MGTIISYAEETFDSFDALPFNAVDSLILSTLAYTRIPSDIPGVRSWEGVRLVDLLRAEHYPTMFKTMRTPENYRRLLIAVAASPRYRNLRACAYTEEFDPIQQTQFAALTFRIDPSLTYVAFRGTDTTLVGWKEDFNMAFQYPVPAQKSAAYYVDRVASHTSGTLYTGGHSKGGNLAVYSTAKCAPTVQSRIGRAYSHDGPGFMETVLQDADFARIAPIIDKTLPQSSIVGMLLEDQENYRVVKSKSVSIWQHDPFTWDVQNNSFVPVDHITPDARYVDKTLQAWVASMDEDERGRLIDTVYDIINVTDAVTFEEWSADLGKTLPAMARSASKMNRDTTDFLGRMLRELVVLGVQNTPVMFGRNKE